jgi:hypothetical protein
LLIVSISTIAQDRNSRPAGERQKYLVTTNSGIVNLIDGELSSKKGQTGWILVDPLYESNRDVVLVEGNRDWKRLTAGDELAMGDSVRSAPGTRAEVLLTPGVYLRLAGETEFVFHFDGDLYQELELKRGSAVIEASVDSWICVTTPKAEVHLVGAGLYRINATGDSVEVAVRDGRAYFGDTRVKQGRRAVQTSGEPLVSRFDNQSGDLLDTWSKDRAKSLIALNKQLSPRDVRNNALITSYKPNVWVYHRESGCYTFLRESAYGWNYPVTNQRWSSPSSINLGRGGAGSRPR